MKIGIFDSGLGGLTVLKTMLKKYPHNEYIYYGDTLNVPYGNKTKTELLKLAIADIEFLISKQVDMIIIACGTISSTHYQYLLTKYSLPIYDIISPTIKYLNQSSFKHIGIIATHNTISSHIFKNNIHKDVIEIETPKLVPLIENNQLDNLDSILSKYLNPYKNSLDCLILGCTHYPIILGNINKYFSNTIPIIDMSNYLFNNLTNDGISKLTIYFSKITPTIISNTQRILNNDQIDIKLSS